VERIFPNYQTLEPEEIYEDLHFPVLPRGRPYVVLNMVTSVDGKATLLGKAYPLGSKTDHMVMRRVRAAVDAVMNGAETLRKEKVNPKVPAEMEGGRDAMGMSPQPTAIVLTSRADLPLDNPFFTADGFRRLVVTTRQAPAERVAAVEQYASVVQVGEDAVDLPALMSVLVKDFGIHKLLCEGGPTTNAGLISAGLVDELFWTIAPKIVGGVTLRSLVEGAPLPLDAIPRLQLVSLHHHEGELYLRYRFAGEEEVA
jgi:2,5-diamino-6-(ribosylamino)-4(3H)-pyrimidinone 5'-phosphate reductase